MFKVKEILAATRGKLISADSGVSLKGVSLDSRSVKKNEIFIALKGDNFDGHDFILPAIRRGAGCVVARRFPRLAKSQKTVLIKVNDTRKALGDIAAYHRRRFDLPFIAVTGSNGKSTAKDMIAWVLSAKYRVLKNEGTRNNQIGLPMALLGLNRSHEAAVLEIGSNHFGEVQYLADIYRPNIGIITNIGLSHLEHFKSLSGVFREKYSLIKRLSAPYLAILNRDDDFLRSSVIAKGKSPFTVGFACRANSDFKASNIKYATGGLEFRVNRQEKLFLATFGRHNIYNGLITVAVARILGMTYRDIAARLARFDFPPGRLKLVRRGAARFFDDSYNSNPFSLKEALRTLADFPAAGRKIFIMGDMLELGKSRKDFHRQAGRDAAAVCDVFITVGRLSRLAAEAARQSSGRTKDIFLCADTKEAAKVLFERVVPQSRDIVLIKGSRAMKMEEIL